MGQLNDKLKKMSLTESQDDTRVIYKENSDNGLILKDKCIPEELLTEILFHVDPNSLLKCQLVCKRWLLLIQGYVWRKKAESVLHRPLPVHGKAHWTTYYAICNGKMFGRNLIQNKRDFRSCWQVINDGGDGWEVEQTPVGVPPYPEDPEFEKNKFCYVTSYQKCSKVQTIYLKEDYPEYLLDTIQPTVKVSEWYSCRWDCPAKYVCRIELIKLDDDAKEVLLDSFDFSKVLEGDEQNQWFKFEHEFNNYGKGLRIIKFYHGGQDRSFWAGHYGSKMGGTSITFEIPNHNENNNKDNIKNRGDKKIEGKTEFNEFEEENYEEDEEESYEEDEE